MVSEFLPSMRLLVSRALRAQGYSQSRISLVLGVTQASVSLYLSSSPARAYDSLQKLGVSRKQAEAYADLLSEDAKGSSSNGVKALNTIWTGLLGIGAACAAHRSLYPSLANCDFCISEYGASRESRTATIAEVAKAVKLLEASPLFAEVMPEVSVNVACAALDAKTPTDIVAIPGRIVKVKGRGRAMLPPEAGASTHMSKVLLLVRQARPEVRACINLRYDRRMAAVLKELGLKALVISSLAFKVSENPTAEALGRSLQSMRSPFDVIVDPGGGGIEPNVYLLASGAREAAETALQIASKYSTR